MEVLIAARHAIGSRLMRSLDVVANDTQARSAPKAASKTQSERRRDWIRDPRGLQLDGSESSCTLTLSQGAARYPLADGPEAGVQRRISNR